MRINVRHEPDSEETSGERTCVWIVGDDGETTETEYLEAGQDATILVFPLARVIVSTGTAAADIDQKAGTRPGEEDQRLPMFERSVIKRRDQELRERLAAIDPLAIRDRGTLETILDNVFSGVDGDAEPAGSLAEDESDGESGRNATDIP